jgi:chromosome partitioning protein
MKVHHRPLETGQDIGVWSKGIRALSVDFLILDSPPHLDAALGGVIGLSDIAVIPCGPSGLDLIATAQTVALVRDIRTARGDSKPLISLVPNRVDHRTASGRDLHAALVDLGEDVTPDIHNRTVLADAFNLGEWVGAYAPNSAAHLEVQAMADHVLSRLGLSQKKRGQKR